MSRFDACSEDTVDHVHEVEERDRGSGADVEDVVSKGLLHFHSERDALHHIGDIRKIPRLRSIAIDDGSLTA